jgi:hypothetical protein
MRIFPIAASLLSACAYAPLTPKQQTQCGPQPTPDQIAAAVQTFVKSVNWKDPDSVHVQNVQLQKCQPHWNGLLNGGGHTVGWEIDFEINAKNSYGGYTGFQLKSVLLTADGNIHWDLE